MWSLRIRTSSVGGFDDAESFARIGCWAPGQEELLALGRVPSIVVVMWFIAGRTVDVSGIVIFFFFLIRKKID